MPHPHKNKVKRTKFINQIKYSSIIFIYGLMFLITVTSATAQWDRGISINYSVINTNSSNYWDLLNSPNSTQFESQVGNILGISWSWLSVLFSTVSYVDSQNTTQNNDFILRLDNQSSQERDDNNTQKTYIDFFINFINQTFIPRGNESRINGNSSGYWDFLDTPFDILISQIQNNAGFYNSTNFPTTLNGDVTGNMSQTVITPNSTTIACNNITGGSDSDYCTDATGSGGGLTNGSNVNFNIINASVWTNVTITESQINNYAANDTDDIKKSIQGQRYVNDTDGYNTTQFQQQIGNIFGISWSWLSGEFATASYVNSQNTTQFNDYIVRIDNQSLQERTDNSTQNLFWTQQNTTTALFCSDRILLTNTTQNNFWITQNTTTETSYKDRISGTNTSIKNYINAQNFANSTYTGNLNLGWANLTDYPAACSLSQTLKTMGDTITCEAIAITLSQVTDWTSHNNTLGVRGDVTGFLSSTEVTPNSTIIACQNITGGTDTDYCTDQTGAGATARTFKQLNTPKITGNNAIWNTTFNFAVAANTNYTYECDWFGNTTAAATGLQINVSANIPNRIWHNVYITNPSTTVAQLYTACSNGQTECINSGINAVVAGVPITIKGRLNNGITAGNINLSIKVETAITGMVAIGRGSYCFIEIEN